MGGGLGVEQWGIKNLGGAADDLEYLVNAIAFNLHFVGSYREGEADFWQDTVKNHLTLTCKHCWMLF